MSFSILKVIGKSVRATLVLTVILCGVYPLVVTGLGQVLFHDQANGGIATKDGKPVGARLIGQAFSKPGYFHGRPSAAGNGYDAANSSGSNLGPTNQKLSDALRSNIDTELKLNPTLKKGEVPVDLVTASASGLDPDISPESAMVQVDRVAKARGVPSDEIRHLVERNVEPPQWAIFGQSRVNVLNLNLALDAMKK